MFPAPPALRGAPRLHLVPPSFGWAPLCHSSSRPHEFSQLLFSERKPLSSCLSDISVADRISASQCSFSPARLLSSRPGLALVRASEASRPLPSPYVTRPLPALEASLVVFIFMSVFAFTVSLKPVIASTTAASGLKSEARHLCSLQGSSWWHLFCSSWAIFCCCFTGQWFPR